MAAGTEVTQTLESSASTYTGGIEGRAIGGNTPEIYFSAITNKKPATRATARRSSVATADVTASLTNTSYISNAIDCGNTIFIELSCQFSVASSSAVVFLALYDANDNFISVTRDYSFQGCSTFLTDNTLYCSASEIVDIRSASKYYPILRVAPSSGNVSIFAEHL